MQKQGRNSKRARVHTFTGTLKVAVIMERALAVTAAPAVPLTSNIRELGGNVGSLALGIGSSRRTTMPSVSNGGRSATVGIGSKQALP